MTINARWYRIQKEELPDFFKSALEQYKSMNELEKSEFEGFIKGWKKKSVKKEVCKDVSILKSETAEEKRVVFGELLIPGEFDLHNDIMTEETIEKAAHTFLSGLHVTTTIGIQHNDFTPGKVNIVESYIQKSDDEISGKKVKKGSWMVAFKINDDDVWSGVKSGAITGFSIGGLANKKPATKDGENG